MPILVPDGTSTSRRIVTLLVGLVLIAPGIACMITAELGVAPFDVVNTGVANFFDIPIGVASVLQPGAFILVGVALGGRVGTGTLICVACVGPMLGGWLALAPELDALLPRLVLFALGFGVLSVGVALTVLPEIGAGPAEVVMLALHRRGLPLAPARTALEVTCVAVGWALGGQIGAGTLIFAVAFGPVLKRLLIVGGYSPAEAAEHSDLAAPGA